MGVSVGKCHVVFHRGKFQANYLVDQLQLRYQSLVVACSLARYTCFCELQGSLGCCHQGSQQMLVNLGKVITASNSQLLPGHLHGGVCVILVLE